MTQERFEPTDFCPGSGHRAISLFVWRCEHYGSWHAQHSLYELDDPDPEQVEIITFGPFDNYWDVQRWAATWLVDNLARLEEDRS